MTPDSNRDRRGACHPPKANREQCNPPISDKERRRDHQQRRDQQQRRDREGACDNIAPSANTLPDGRVSDHTLPDGRVSDCGCVSDHTLPDGRVSDSGCNLDCGRVAKTDCGSVMEGSWPLAYLITFTTYGTWLHGDDRGSVDPKHNIPGTPLIDQNPKLRTSDRRALKHPPVTLDSTRRAVVGKTIREVCEHRDWTLHALNVRTNHVHVVIGAPDVPERLMNTLKSWSTRRMVEADVLPAKVKPWVRHGSTRYLWKSHQIEAACRYVCEDQGVDLDEAD